MFVAKQKAFYALLIAHFYALPQFKTANSFSGNPAITAQNLALQYNPPRFRLVHQRQVDLLSHQIGRRRIVLTTLTSSVLNSGQTTVPDSKIEPIRDFGIGIGIDLGTTNSVIAFYDEDSKKPKIVPIPKNGNTMPSVVAIVHTNSSFSHTIAGGALQDQGYTVLLGSDAIQYEKTRKVDDLSFKQETIHSNIFRNVKRIIGTGGKLKLNIKSIVPQVAINSVGKTYKKESLENAIYDAENNPTYLNLYFNDTKQTIRPEEISSYILKFLIDAAQNYTSRNVSRAVVGVPAYFNDAQRNATLTACTLAGLSKVKLLREPEAAALAYGVKLNGAISDKTTYDIDNFDTDDELVLVFDLGGGTFDVSMLLMGGGVTEVLSTSGNTMLGGSDWDSKILTFLFKIIQQHNGHDATKWPDKLMQQVLRTAEQVRIYLSNNNRINLALPIAQEGWNFLNSDQSVILPPAFYNQSEKNGTVLANNETHYVFSWTRREMESLCIDEFKELIRPIREVAIMSGALLPGDSSPALVEAAMLDEEDTNLQKYMDLNNFYDDIENNFDMEKKKLLNEADNDLVASYITKAQEAEMRDIKKAQQRGRKRARITAKEERKFRGEKRKVENSYYTKQQFSQEKKISIRDGITGKPISSIVLVGGATRMPAIGRLLKALTGIVPKATVNPDEAVALGCAVHIANLDGQQSAQRQSIVLNPMQAAIVRAMAMQQKRQMQQEKDTTSDNDIFEN